jgi:replicative DNA helicase
MQDFIVEYDRQLFVSDLGGQTVAQLRAYLLKLRETQDVRVAVVDYLQLISASNSRASKYEQISQISVDLKNLAKELDIAIIALAQLNRRVDSGKADDRPVASDLRDSGQIEQDADVIMLLSREQNDDDKFRDDRINSGDAQAKLNADMLGYKSVMLVDVVKNRHGRTGMFKARFDGDHSRIVEF